MKRQIRRKEEEGEEVDPRDYKSCQPEFLSSRNQILVPLRMKFNQTLMNKFP